MTKITSTYGKQQAAIARIVEGNKVGTTLTIAEWAELAGVANYIVRNYIQNSETPLLEQVSRGVYRRVASPVSK